MHGVPRVVAAFGLVPSGLAASEGASSQPPGPDVADLLGSAQAEGVHGQTDRESSHYRKTG